MDWVCIASVALDSIIHHWHKKQKKWVARLKFKGKIMNFGSFSNFEDAVKARHRAEEEYFGTFLAAIDEQDK